MGVEKYLQLLKKPAPFAYRVTATPYLRDLR